MVVTEEILIGSKADTRGFKKAESAANKLQKQVKSLGKTFGVALGATAIAAYGKASVKAFSADEAAAARLANAVDNLGLSYSKVKVADFISQTEASAGILDDVLRPAMQALLTTTGSLTKSQELLNNAIQISRASGIDLATVSQDLANGFVGITRGLKKYNTGLTQAELKSKSFNEILGIMLARSAGAAQAYLTTTSYKLDVLTVASNNAKETIGKGLVDAFARIGGGTEASDAAKAIDSIAKGINNITLVVGTAIGLVEKLYKGFVLIGDLGGLIGENGPIFGRFVDKGPSTNRSKSPAGTAARTAQQRQAEATAAKRAKELESLTKKQVASQKALTAEQKKQALLKKAGSIFDLEQIQLIAALKGNLSEEDRKRVELQFALIVGNTKEAQRLTYELATAQGLSKDLAGYLASLPDAKNPFASWSAYLDDLKRKAQEVVILAPGGGGSPVLTLPSMSGGTGGNTGNRIYVGGQGIDIPATNTATLPSSSGTGGGQATTYVGGTPIYVQIDGKTIATANQSQSLSGIPSNVSRVNGMFAG